MVTWTRSGTWRWTAGFALACAALLVASATGASAAGGGTAKPPPVAAPFKAVPHPAVPAPSFTNVPDTHQFDMTGFIADADVDGSICPGIPADRSGGHVTINGIAITVPCNSVVQMPANTLKWPEAVDVLKHPSLTLKGGAYPSFEAHVVGNSVGDEHRAALVFLSQQAVNTGVGYITSIDYATGRIRVGSKPGGRDQAILEINDPNGRFGRPQSPDDRFSVDDQNPTIHAATGYPMCVPRTDPAAADDPLCPQQNRPKVVNGTCRDWLQAGVNPLPASGNLPPPTAGALYCNHFVMNSVAARAAADPDPRQHAPFEVGDHVTYAGTLFKGAAGQPDFISAHTVLADVGIFTQPGTQPAYIALGEFGVGSADPSVTSVNGAPQETQDRIFLEAETTDIVTPVDVYLNDIDPVTGAVVSRWITPFAMTNEVNGPMAYPYGPAVPDNLVGGGITTQFKGAQPGRVRLRATKAPLGLLTSPTRTLRVVQRTLCLPPLSLMPPGSDYGANKALEINKQVDCTKGQPAANGLFAGQYSAPVFDFIFAENLIPGDNVVPADFWDLGFLVNGEGPGTGPLVPKPW
jgi:hypothetical protein